LKLGSARLVSDRSELKKLENEETIAPTEFLYQKRIEVDRAMPQLWNQVKEENEVKSRK